MQSMNEAMKEGGREVEEEMMMWQNKEREKTKEV